MLYEFEERYTLLPNQACVVGHIFSYLMSTLEYTVPIAVDQTPGTIIHNTSSPSDTYMGEMCGHMYNPPTTLNLSFESLAPTANL